MNEDQKKYLKAAIMTAISIAGVGAFIRNWKAKKERKKSLDINNGKNTIVIPIVKEDFMRGIPTPDERADEMDGNIVAVDSGNPIGDGAFGKVFNFFRKNASEEEKGDNEKSKSEGIGAPVNEKKVTEEKIDGRIVLRGQDGKFVSPTDPVAVMDVEKTAQMGIVDSLLHPGDFAKNVARAFKGNPLWMAGGAVGSIILATKIVDYLAKERRRKAEKRLEDARESYVNLLENGEGSEKKAQSDIPGIAGTVLGTAFFLPLALTAMVANKIIENRDAERRRKKSMSNSYPQDPTFVYNVVDGEKIAMSTDRALALMMFKTAMVASCEDSTLEKNAQVTDALKALGDKLDDKARGMIPVDEIKDDEARDEIIKLLGNNDKEFLDIIRKKVDGDKDAADKALKNLILTKNPTLLARLYKSKYDSDPNKRNSLENSIYSSKGLTDLVANRFTDDKYKDSFGSYADELIGKKMGLRQGSFLHKLVTWLMGLFGMKKGLIGEHIGKYMNDIRKPIQKERARWNEIDKMNDTLGRTGEKLKNINGTLGAEHQDSVKNVGDALDGTQQKLDRTGKILDSTPSPASWDDETAMEAVPSNADYEQLSELPESPKTVTPGQVPKPSGLLGPNVDRPWFENQVEGKRPSSPLEPVNPKERVPNWNDFSWNFFRNIPSTTGDNSLRKIVGMGKDQFEYNAGMNGARPYTPVNRGSGEIPVNVGLVNKELGIGEAYDENGNPAFEQWKKDDASPANNKPVASPIITR